MCEYRLEMIRQNYERTVRVLVRVKAGIEHLWEKVFYAHSSVINTPEDENESASTVIRVRHIEVN